MTDYKSFHIVITAFFSIATLSLWPASAKAQAPQIKPPVVVELFTSQGCSSCPPADKILESLAVQDNIITLGCHVQYWDRLGWEDSLGREFCATRQHGYAGDRGDRKIYTPQMIVNGGPAFIGSHRGELNAALEQAYKNPIQPIKATLENGIVRFQTQNLPQGPDIKYHLWAFGYKNSAEQSIGGGENGGHKITYTTPALSMINIGRWDGRPLNQRMYKPEEDLDGLVFIAQDNAYGHVVAAGKLSFKKGH